jgi:Arc/MetJ-type ribon-helix-helix transcriptional regulator
MARVSQRGVREEGREPVQVYLDSQDRKRLERLQHNMGANKSEVLRRGLRALERELMDPEEHPVLRIIGMMDGVPAGGAPVAEDTPPAGPSHRRHSPPEREPEPRRGSKKKKKQRDR